MALALGACGSDSERGAAAGGGADGDVWTDRSAAEPDLGERGQPDAVADGPEGSVGPDALTIAPGVGIGPVLLGMSLEEVSAAVGAPASPMGFQRLYLVRYDDLGLEVVMTSPDSGSLAPGARVIAVGTLAGGTFEGPVVPGDTLEEAQEALGVDADAIGSFVFGPPGLSVEHDGEVVTRVAVGAAYAVATEPPEMAHAATLSDAEGPRGAPVEDAGVTYQGVQVEVVDMHLHPGTYGTMNPDGKAFIVGALPPFTALYYAALTSTLLDPHGEHIGIRSQMDMAGVSRAVLLAVYSHHTTGYLTNEALEAWLADPRNTTADGSPWAYGMASINFDDFEDAQIRDARYQALASYFEQRPDLFIGIKLAHAHQGVAFDDPAYLGVYDVAAAHGVPVLLHTGFSPFPNTQTSPEYYDPAGLEAVIATYDGVRANRVDFVLAHAGQGDPASLQHALELAESYDNVWLEISALGRPLATSVEGGELGPDEPQLPWVLEQILARDLVDRALFASDGPQFSGMVVGYVAAVAEAMDAAGYSVDQARAVFAGNFYTLYGVGAGR